MLKNYIKIALRNLYKGKVYSLINIGGLSIGLAGALFIYAYVTQELSFDKFHENSGEIYRVGFDVDLGSGKKVIATTGFPVAEQLRVDFPDLEEVIQISRLYDGEVTANGKKVMEERIAFADSLFFEFYSFDLISGSKTSVLDQPNSLVISESMALKYFGSTDVLGKDMLVQEPFGDRDMPMVISGVMKDMPVASHFHIDFLVSMGTSREFYPESIFESWGWDSQYTYIRLPRALSGDDFNQQLADFSDRLFKDYNIKFFAYPIEKIHLHSNINSEIEANSNIIYVYIFSVVGIILVLLASVNYMNMSTARAMNRSKEISIRKSVGAARSQIILQFLGEAVITSFLALLLGGLIAELAAAQLESSLGVNVQIDILNDPKLLISFISFGLILGIFSGSYPALYISSFNPAKVLKSGGSNDKSPNALRKVLVLFQFILSSVLIIGSIVVYNQLNFLRSKNLGVQVEQNIVLPPTQAISQRMETFKNKLNEHPRIASVTTSSRRLGVDINSGEYYKIDVNGKMEEARLSNIFVDYNFLNHFEAKIIAGRGFNKNIASDSSAVILNESAAKVFGFQNLNDALNKPIESWFNAHVVGIVNDFHFETIHNRIKPMVFVVDPTSTSWMSIKVKGDRLKQSIDYIQSVWNEFETNREFRYSFLEDNLYNLYQAEERFVKVFTLFVVLALFIACLGLLGLVAYTVSKRLPEIGIRKVLGASVLDIAMLLNKDFLKIVLIANIIAYPLAYFGIQQWLQNFEYRIDMPWLAFIVSTLVIVGVALFTISFNSIKAALLNPVSTLNEE
ncbi:FtsX-like permease family protein [Fulvivirga sp.]|uniref:ABC transporter permease n=1 Tax=Fulvivirga sp. TaxID=1931237 RepID=UPI0032EDBC21